MFLKSEMPLIALSRTHSGPKPKVEASFKVLVIRFLEKNLQHTVLWEIPYPNTFAVVTDVYDRNMTFYRFYELVVMF